MYKYTYMYIRHQVEKVATFMPRVRAGICGPEPGTSRHNGGLIKPPGIPHIAVKCNVRGVSGIP